MARDILRQPKIYSPPKEQEKFVLPKFLKIIIWVVIILAVLFYLFLFSPLFKIRNIQIEGTPTDETRTYLETFKGGNIFLLKTGPIQQQLVNANPQFLNINIFKGIPNILRVVFQERTPKIIWKSGDNQYLVDDQGIAYKESDAMEVLPQVIDTKAMAVNLPMQVATSNFIDFVTSAESTVKTDDLKIDHFEIGDTIFQVSAVTNKNIKIIFDTTHSLSDQNDAFQKVYSEHKNDIKEYLDVRVEGVVYYK
jgi:cell division septal protein FtsQ